MKKIILILFLSISVHKVTGQKWIVKDSILVFPDGFASWLKRNNGGVDLYNPGPGNGQGPQGNIGTNQGVDLYDFNKDGLPDLTFQLFPSNNITREYLKGIFIQNKNGQFVLDTNYVIKAKGDMWLGGFGDFNGDGLNDYHYITGNYHGLDSNRKYSPEMVNDNWPDRVFINNGKGFDTLSLDIENLTIESTYTADVDGDGADEIIATDRGPDFVLVYKYDKIKKNFYKIYKDISELWLQKFDLSIFGNPRFNIANSNDANGFAIIFTDSSNSKVLNQPHWQPFNFRTFTYAKYNFKTKKIDSYSLNRDSILIPVSYSREDADDYYKFNIHEKITAYKIDIDKNGEEEIVVGGFYMNDYYVKGISRYAYGWKVLGLNGKDLTNQFFKDGGFDKNTELFAHGIDIDKTADGIEMIPGSWGNRGWGELGNYYKIVNGKFEKNYIRDIRHLSGKILDSSYFKNIEIIMYPNYQKNRNALVMYDFNNVKKASIIYQLDCTDISKPTFNTSKFSFCSNDSLKLTITNFNKGDTIKWYFGTKSDLTNVANKTFTDSTKLFVTRTDSLGCIISSDTIQLKKFAIPGSPSISRDVDNNLVSNSIGNIWYKDGVKIADTTQKIKPTSNGLYTATTTQNGCTSSISQGYYYITNAVSNLSTGEYFKVSPNPTSGELNINYRFSSSKDVYISIIDMNGRNQILNKKINSGSKINIGSFSKGNYIIQVKDKTGRLITSQKVVKE